MESHHCLNVHLHGGEVPVVAVDEFPAEHGREPFWAVKIGVAHVEVVTFFCHSTEQVRALVPGWGETVAADAQADAREDAPSAQVGIES